MQAPSPAAAQPIRDQLIWRAEIEAERTVAIVRLFVAVLLAFTIAGALALLPFAPPRVAERQIGNAWLVILAFLGLGLVSYVVARPGWFRPWMPWVFTLGDGLFVLFNIHASLVNQGVSAAFAPIFPAVWVAPVVLSFGVLRYRPALQGMAGLLIVAGVLVLAWRHPAGAPEALPLYLFQGPPNAARLAMFTAVVAILVLAAQRRRLLLTRAIEEILRRAEYQRYLPPPVADLVARGEIARLRQGWRTEAAILLVDIRGFTALAESLEPEALGRFVTAFRRRITATVEAHGGLVDKFVGDGAVVLFGVLDAAPDAAARALACARALTADLVAADGRPLQLAIGAHWGEVVAGAVGDDGRLEFTVLGDAVNVAARLEEESKALDRPLLASRALVHAAGAEAAWRPFATRTPRGRTGAIELMVPG